MSVLHTKATADTQKSRTLPPWAYVAVLTVAAIGLAIYRLVVVGLSLANLGFLLLVSIIGLFFIVAVAYLERVAHAEKDELSNELDRLGNRIERLEREIKDLPDDLVVRDDRWSHGNPHVAR